MMRSCVVWVQLNRALKFLFGSIEVEVVDLEDVGQRSVRFGQRIVECERLFCSCLRLRIAILRSACGIKWHYNIGVSQAYISERVFWIRHDSLIEVVGRLLEIRSEEHTSELQS